MDWIVLEGKLAGCVAEFYVNGIPVGMLGREQVRQLAVPVNEYLVPGVNTLAALVNPGPTPSEAETPQPPRSSQGERVEARLARYPEDAVTGDGSGVPLLTVSWEGSDAEQAFPVTVRQEADLGPVGADWAWLHADRLKLRSGDRTEIARIVERIRSGLAGADPAAYLELAETSLTDTATAYGRNDIDFGETMRQMVSHSAEEDYWSFPPLADERWSLRTVADGRLVEVIADDWEPIVRTIENDEGDSYSLFFRLGKIGGRWAVLR